MFRRTLPRTRLLIRDDTLGFDPDDPESTMNARHIRAEQFVKEHYGKLDTALAEAYLSDHYDSYEHKIDAGKRSLCGHEDTSSVGEKVWGDPPFDPAGAVTGKVMDSDMAAKMSFIGSAGHPCGENFIGRAVSCRASGICVAEADSARHERGTVDEIHGGRETAGGHGAELERLTRLRR